MNKHFIYMGAAIASVFMASCSNDDIAGGAGGNKSDLASDEAISIAVNQIGNSRASLGNVDEDGKYDGTFDAEGLGIYCLAADKIAGKQEISWAEDYNDKNPNFVWFQNRKADAVTSTKTFTVNDVAVDKKVTDLVWKETQTEDNLYSFYYPIGAQYRYDFYGYYPYKENVSHNNETFSVEYTDLDGTKDVIWGKSNVAVDDADKASAYSAQYFRKKKDACDAAGTTYDKKNYLPNIKFSHKLMKFNIIIKKGTGEVDNIEEYGVKEAKLQNVCTKGTLVIASRDNADQEGVFTPDWTQTTTLTLKEADDSDLREDNFLGTEEQRTIGGGFLIPVLPNVDGVYTDNGYHGTNGETANKGLFRLEVEFNQKNSNNKFKAAQYDIVPPADGWKEGYEYDIVIAISTPLVIEGTATLTPWEKGTINLE